MDAGRRADAGPSTCPPLPSDLQGEVVPNAEGYHSILFDDDGNIVTAPGAELVRGLRGEVPQPFARVRTTQIHQMEWMDDGSIALIDDWGLRRVAPSGGTEVLVGDFIGYGVTRGPGGTIYAAAGSRVYRYAPATGEVDEFLAGGQFVRVIEFSADYRTMYFGVQSLGSEELEGPHLWRWAMDEDGAPVGQPELFARGIGGYHDALRMDQCGNLWLLEANDKRLYRVFPDGSFEIILEWPFDAERNSDYGHSITWGTGEHGWRSDAIYMAMPYGDYRVQELVIGVGPVVRR